MSFVTRSGTNFMLDGQIWRPFGATIYSGTNPQTTTLIDARISDALILGLNILRVVNFIPSSTAINTEFTEAHWAAIDYVLHKARQNGLKVLIDCSDYAAKEQNRGHLFADQDWTTYIDFVCNRVNTYNGRIYRSDDTIALFSVIGEPATGTGLPELMTHATQMFRTKGAQQLTGIGAIEYYHSTIDQVAAIPTVDYVGTHPYNNNLGSRLEVSIREYRDRAILNNKPWIFEEFGTTANVGDQAWARFMRGRYKLGLKYGVSGFLYWNLEPESTQPTTNTDYNIGTTGHIPLTEQTVKTFSHIVQNLGTNNYSYVSAENGRFKKDGKRFRYIGANCYPLVIGNYSANTLDTFFSKCRDNGITVVRTWCHNGVTGSENVAGNFQYISGTTMNFRESQFAQLDLVLDKARQYGIKLSLVLSNQFSYITKGQYCRWNNTINGTAYDTSVGDPFHTDANIINNFKSFISALLNRTNTMNGRLYYEDDAIFGWEMGNELRYVAGTDTNVNTANSARIAVMTSWYGTIAAYIKSIDVNHLVGTGSITQFYDYTADDPIHNGSYYGVDYSIHHALSDVDYFDFHIYPYNDNPTFTLRDFGQQAGVSGGTQGFLAQLSQFASLAKAAGKPVVVGEYGLDKRNTVISGYKSYPRDANFKRLLKDWFQKYNGDGFLFWHYATAGILDDNNYNIKPDGLHTGGNANSNLNDDDTRALSIIKQMSYRIAGKKTPVGAQQGGAVL